MTTLFKLIIVSVDDCLASSYPNKAYMSLPSSFVLEIEMQNLLQEASCNYPKTVNGKRCKQWLKEQNLTKQHNSLASLTWRGISSNGRALA